MEVKQIVLWTFGILISTMVRTSLGQMYGMFDNYDSTPVFEGGNEPINVSATAGYSAVLPCVVKNLGSAVITWHDVHMNLLQMEDDSNMYIDTSEPNQNKLVIKNVDSQHSGSYTCMVNVIPPLFKTINLEVQAQPQINKTKLKGHIIIKEGENISLTCDVTGSPRPTVVWYAKDQEKKNIRSQLTTTGTLEIPYAGPTKTGIYSCEAGNIHGTDMFEVYVEVEFRPRIRCPRHYAKVKVGESASFNCYVLSSPSANIYWQYVEPKSGGKNIKNVERYMLRDFEVNQTIFEHELTISNIQQSDAGLYKIIASNSVGYAEEPFHLVVASATTTTTTTTTLPTTTSTTSVTTTTTSPKTVPLETSTLTSSEIFQNNQPYENKEKDGNGPKTGSSLDSGACNQGNGIQIFYLVCSLFMVVYL